MPFQSWYSESRGHANVGVCGAVMLESPTPELAHAFRLFLHDIRTPLGAASGLLRLLGEERIPPGLERERAIARSLEALGRVTKLCAVASAYVDARTASSRAITDVPASLIYDRLLAATTAPVVPLPEDDGVRTCRVRLVSLDALVDAILTITSTMAVIAAPSSSRALQMATSPREMLVLFGSDEERGRLRAAPRTFDPWGGDFGLAFSCACHTVQDNGGSVWVLDDSRGTVGLSVAVGGRTP